MIKKRFEEGELDECPLTLKDLTKIKESFLNVLVAFHHTRVKYPQAPKKRTPRARPADLTDEAVARPEISSSPPQSGTPSLP